MRIIVKENYEKMSKEAALLTASQIKLQPDSVLGLATGSTPLGMYENLIKMNQNKELDFSRVKTFNLDEYYKIKADNPKSYHYYMKNNFFAQINIPEKNWHIPDGMAKDVHNECERYDNLIKKSGGIDLQILGIGTNGHIGFNEPAEKIYATTHLIDLKEKTIESNSRFFDSKEEMPRQALTMGISTILKAKRIIMLASGKEKAEAIKKTVNGYVSTNVPSSLLQTHPNFTLIIDREAASHLDI